MVQMIRAWDRAHERPEPGTPVTFPKTSAPKPSMEAIAVRTEIGEFSELPNGIITWKFGEMHAALNRYEWHDMMEIVPAVLEALGKELGG